MKCLINIDFYFVFHHMLQLYIATQNNFAEVKNFFVKSLNIGKNAW